MKLEKRGTDNLRSLAPQGTYGASGSTWQREVHPLEDRWARAVGLPCCQLVDVLPTLERFQAKSCVPWKGQTSREVASVASRDKGLCKGSGNHWQPVGNVVEAGKTEKGWGLCFLQGRMCRPRLLTHSTWVSQPRKELWASSLATQKSCSDSVSPH